MNKTISDTITSVSAISPENQIFVIAVLAMVVVMTALIVVLKARS